MQRARMAVNAITWLAILGIGFFAVDIMADANDADKVLDWSDRLQWWLPLASMVLLIWAGILMTMGAGPTRDVKRS